MAKVVLELIEEPLPADAKVVAFLPGNRLMRMGEGRDTVICAACSKPVVKGVDIARLGRLVYQCGACCAYNGVPTHHP